MKTITSSILIFICSVFTSCQDNGPYADSFTKEKPLLSDIQGNYKFEEQTYIETTANFQPANIFLKADGNYVASNIPDLMNDPTDTTISKTISTTGKWELKIIDSIEDGWGHKQPSWGVMLNNMPKSLSQIRFMNNSAPYKLIINFSDFDLGEVMILSKE